MAFLAVIGSKSTNGVAYIHSEIIKETILKVRLPPCSACKSEKATELTCGTCIFGANCIRKAFKNACCGGTCCPCFA